MAKVLIHHLVLLVPLIACYGPKKEEKQDNFEELYLKGKEAYLENNFEECVTLFEAALADYRHYKESVRFCNVKCSSSENKKVTVLKHSPDMEPFEGMIHQTLCNMKCKRKRISKHRVETVKEETRNEFQSRKPYDYIQLCYFQTGDHVAAANAAFTHLVANPDHEAMRENLKFYLALHDVDKDNVNNLESLPYVDKYLASTEYYRTEEWENMVEGMEEALTMFLQAEEECRLDCDKPFDMGWYPDFTSSVSNHFTFCLKCRVNCAEQLNNFNGEYMDDLLPSFYHYLQFGYYKSERMEMAAQAAATFLFLQPDHSDMKGNMEYYQTVIGVGDEWSEPRREAVEYMLREQDEQNLLDFISEKFVFPDEEDEEETVTELEADAEADELYDEDELSDLDEIEESSLDEDEFIAQWSDEEEKFIIQDKSEESIGLTPVKLNPPPVVKFSWGHHSEL